MTNAGLSPEGRSMADSGSIEDKMLMPELALATKSRSI